MENSEWLGRQAGQGIEPGISRLRVLSAATGKASSNRHLF